MADDYNTVFERICQRSTNAGDEIIAFIAYGIYKERKRDFIINRGAELNSAVPQSEIDLYHKTWNDGQIDLAWNRAKEVLAEFGVNYAEQEKQAAVKAALVDALRGSFWKNVLVNAAANFIFAIGAILIYFLLRFSGFDLLDKLRKLEQILPPN